MKHLKPIFETLAWKAPEGDLLMFLDNITQEIKDEYDANVSYEEGYKYFNFTTTHIKVEFDLSNNEFNCFKIADLKVFNKRFHDINEKLIKIMEKLETEGYWCSITLDLIGGETNYIIEFSQNNLDK
jgi:hypothetical protein